MSEKKQKTKSGFSIIELLVVMFIAVVMTAVVFAIRNNASKAKNEVDTVSRIVAAQLRTLQSDAVNGKQITDSGTTYSICRARMLAMTSSPSFSFNYLSRTGPDCDATSKVIGGQTVNLSKYSVNLSMNPANNIGYNVPRGELAQGGNVRILITSSRSGASSVASTVCACRYGSVREEKDTVTNCDSVCQ